MSSHPYIVSGLVPRHCCWKARVSFHARAYECMFMRDINSVARCHLSNVINSYISLSSVKHKVTEHSQEVVASEQYTDQDMHLPLLLFMDIKLGEERKQIYLIAAPVVHSHVFVCCCDLKDSHHLITAVNNYTHFDSVGPALAHLG